MAGNLLFMLKYTWKYTRGYFIQLCLLAIYSSIEVFFEFIYCTNYMIDLIQNKGSFRSALIYILCVDAAIIIKVVWMTRLNQNIAPKSKEILHKEMQKELYQKALSLDLSCYDDPSYYNEFVWSINQVNTRMDQLLEDLKNLIGAITTIVIMSIFFLTVDKTGLIFISASLIITLLSNAKIGKLTFERDMELKPIERKRNYFNRVFFLCDYTKEIRLFHLAKQLKEDFCRENEKVYPIMKRYGNRQAFLGFIGDYLASNFMINCSYLVYLCYKTIILGALSCGRMIALFNASSNLKNNLQTLSTLYPKLRQHSLYIDKIRHFLYYETKIKNLDEAKDITEIFKELVFEKVSFGYRKDDQIIHEISLTIHAGEKIALVGYNGSGKTTLTKLLMRLYDVEQGKILWNGTDIREYKVSSYRKNFGSVFQDYNIYATTIADNVKMDLVQEEDKKGISQGLKESGFSLKLDQLEHGLDTPLTKEFEKDGVNLSGGENQKIAIARVFLKECPIIILDEPSSALDPISEYNLNHSMIEISKKKTVIFISHRLSSTVMADRIFMMEKGRIIEQGTHQELMKQEGKYANMFKLQADKYVENV